MHGTFCGGCGTPVVLPAPPDDALSAGPAGPVRPAPAAAAGAVAVALLLVGGSVLLGRSDAGPTPAAPAAEPAAEVPAGGIAAPGLTASSTRAGSRDGAGRATSYEPARAFDGDPTTAWRCDGSGVGQWITVTFPTPVRITRVGLIPGLAKTDPGDGTDRYAQNRRIAAVRIATDAGAVDARLDTSPDNRSVQTVDLGAPVVTRSLTLSVLDSTSGVPRNGEDAVDSVAISEITLA